VAIRLRDGSLTHDPRLDRLVQFDERSRDYPITADPRFSTVLKSRTWGLKLRLDQGREGACTGFARAHDLAAHPSPARGISNAVAQDLYYRARRLDEWPGENYEGSSVLGAILAAREVGYVGEFRWGFGIDQTLGALSNVAGVVFGTPWLDSMYEPGPDGILDLSGTEIGGHSYFGRGICVPVNGYIRPWANRKAIKTSVPMIRVTNSWDRDWGIDGEALIPADGMEDKLLSRRRGEACITTRAFAKPWWKLVAYAMHKRVFA